MCFVSKNGYAANAADVFCGSFDTTAEGDGAFSEPARLVGSIAVQCKLRRGSELAQWQLASECYKVGDRSATAVAGRIAELSEKTEEKETLRDIAEKVITVLHCDGKKAWSVEGKQKAAGTYKAMLPLLDAIKWRPKEPPASPHELGAVVLFSDRDHGKLEGITLVQLGDECAATLYPLSSQMKDPPAVAVVDNESNVMHFIEQISPVTEVR